MKITAKQYAQVLLELTQGKNESEIDGAVAKFAGKLRDNGQLKLLKAIIKKFGEIYNQKNGIVEAEVISRKKLSSKLPDKLNSFVSKKYNVEKVILKDIIDEKIKGGIIIKVGDEILDGSVNRRLRELEKAIGN